MYKYIIIITIVIIIIIAAIAAVVMMKSTGGNKIINSKDYAVPYSMDTKDIKYITGFYKDKLKKHIDELHIVKDDESFGKLILIILIYLSHMTQVISQNKAIVIYDKLTPEDLTYMGTVQTLLNGKPDLLIDIEFIPKLSHEPYTSSVNKMITNFKEDTKLILMSDSIGRSIERLSMMPVTESFYNY